MNRRILHYLGGMVLLGFALSGCMSSSAPGAAQPTAVSAPATSVAAPSPVATRPTAAPSPAVEQPTAVPTVGVPTFSFTPQSGGPGTRVVLNGWNFAPGKPIVIRLGRPDPVGEVLVAGAADAQGKWNAVLTMPDRLPSGEVIAQRDLQLVVMNDANVALASAPFAFTPAAGNSIPPREAASQTVRDLLNAYQKGGDTRAFLSADLRARMDAGEQLDQVLDLLPAALISFEVGVPLNRPADALFIPAQLSYSTAEERREFAVVLDQNSWRVAGSAEPLGEIPAPMPDPATQEWHSALSADINGDGITEQITYRTGKAKVSTPVGFSDPSIAMVIIAEEMFVNQEVSPGGRTLLYLNPHALGNGDQMLLPMIKENEAPPGFVVIVYGGDRYSYYITPIMSDGTPYNQSARVVWSDEQNAYVLG